MAKHCPIHFSPDTQQLDRIERLKAWAITNLPVIWAFDDSKSEPRGFWGRTIEVDADESPFMRDDARKAKLEQTMAGMRTVFDEKTLPLALADFYLFPATVEIGWPRRGENDFPFRALRLLTYILDCHFAYVEPVSPYAAHLMMKRLAFMVKNPQHGLETYLYGERQQGFLWPDMPVLVDLIEHNVDFNLIEEPFIELIEGRWNTPIDDEMAAEELFREGSFEGETSHEWFRSDLQFFCWRGLLHLARKGMLSDERYQKFLTSNPDWTPSAMLSNSKHAANSLLSAIVDGFSGKKLCEQDRAVLEMIRVYTRRFVEGELAAPVDGTNRALDTLHRTALEGSDWLIHACERIAGNKGYKKDESWPVMCAIRKLGKDETDESLAERLGSFKPAVLKAVLPHACQARVAVLMALGIPEVIALNKWFYTLTHGRWDGEFNAAYPFGNCAEVKQQVLDQQGLAEALQGVSDKAIDTYLNAVKADSLLRRAILMVQAYRGKNAEDIAKRAGRLDQTGLKALGLLPVQSETVLIERYALLNECLGKLGDFGVTRRTNTRAAIKVGLNNLAIRGGFANLAAMQASLEAQTNEVLSAALTDQVIADWRVELAFEGLKPVLLVSKAGQRVKTVPAALRKNTAFIQMKEALNTFKKQASRFRQTFEQMMINEQIIASMHLDKLSAMATSRLMLTKLVGIDSAGNIGFIDAERKTLHYADQHRPIDGDLRIAHVHDLFCNNVLALWQERVAQAAIVQPFKQVFREYYVPTPVELQGSGASARFVNREIKKSVVRALLIQRDWLEREEDYFEKALHKGGLSAQFGWSDTEERAVVSSDELMFVADASEYFEPVAISLVPPVAFSEIMRDVDLLVTVASVSKHGVAWSAEQRQHHIDVISWMAEAMGIEALRFEGDFAFLRGFFHEYRIDLRNANVYTSTNHLCIGLEKATNKQDTVLLPFADDNPVLSELIAKIVLLHDDESIKDTDIRNQLFAIKSE